MTAADHPRPRVLLVPDYLYWITGSIAKAVVRHNPWLEGTVVSGQVLRRLSADDPDFLGRFDLVHFTDVFVSKAYLPSLRNRLPCVASVHHVTDWPFVEHNFAADAVMVGSREWQGELVRHGVPEERVVRVPYGVDATLFRPASADERRAVRRRLGIPDGGPVVGFFSKRTSNTDDRKGVDVFTRAVELLHAERPGTRPLIVGPGWGDVVEALRARGIACSYFPFLKTQADVAAAYRALDFYWITSRVEGGPVTLLEAMSSEVCCLSTAVGIARDCVEDGVNGSVVAQEDAEGFAAKTAALARDPERLRGLSAAGRKTILEKFDLPVTARQVRGLYERALAAFAARTGRPIVALPDLSGGEKDVLPDAEVYLGGVPKRLRSWVLMRERLSWAEALIHQGEKRSAVKLIGRACLGRPLAREPWKALLGQVTPQPVQRALGGVKRLLRGPRRPVASRPEEVAPR
jgi:glycosyltransferase involved in cell wall biosynthesis